MSLFESGESNGSICLSQLFKEPEQIAAVNDLETLDEDTVLSYIDALKKIFVIEDMAAWNPNLRSKTAIRTSDTRYYIDPSIGVAALGLGPNNLINDL